MYDAFNYEEEQEPIVLSKPTLDLLLKQECPSDLIALYTFYYYTAKWQKTNAPKCSTGYVANGLNWPENRVRRSKQTLSSLGLIEDYPARDPETQKITGHFVRVKFIWTKEKANEAEKLSEQEPPSRFSIGWPKPEGGVSHRVENREGNALRAISLNALDISLPTKPGETERVEKPFPKSKRNIPNIEEEPAPNPSITDRTELFLPLAEQLADIVKSVKNVSTPAQRLKQWANEIRKLSETSKINPARIKRALDWYANNVGGEFIPVIESGSSLRDKFTRLEDAIKRSEKNAHKQQNQSNAPCFNFEEETECDDINASMKEAVQRAQEYEERTGKKAPWIYRSPKTDDE